MKKFWYAVMINENDDDWGMGSYDLDEAKRMADRIAEEYSEDAYIAVIDETDRTCVDVYTRCGDSGWKNQFSKWC